MVGENHCEIQKWPAQDCYSLQGNSSPWVCIVSINLHPFFKKDTKKISIETIKYIIHKLCVELNNCSENRSK